jgi:hypothetical protein
MMPMELYLSSMEKDLVTKKIQVIRRITRQSFITFISK